jgi:phage shock protein B
MHSAVPLVLGILFLTVVAPIWITAHYGSRWRARRNLSAEDERKLAGLWAAADAMEARVVALERVIGVEPEAPQPGASQHPEEPSRRGSVPGSGTDPEMPGYRNGTGRTDGRPWS